MNAVADNFLKKKVVDRSFHVNQNEILIAKLTIQNTLKVYSINSVSLLIPTHP